MCVCFYVFQIATVVILSLAANTAYAGMPLLLAMVARDGYMPRRYTQRGARLNFSNGVLLIFFASSALIFLFNADTHTLLPLYATGVFISFTISQAGMLAHWVRLKTPGWHHKAVINALGTVVCAVVCLVIAITRFTEGAWVVVILIPLLVYVMKSIKKHYASVSADLTLRSTDEAAQLHEHENLTVMMGALVVTSPLKKLLHNQTTQRLSKKLERYRNVSVFTVPYII